MIIIGIDPSLSSTAITIYKNSKFSIYNYTNKKPDYKWIKEINTYVEFRFHEFEDIEDYSKSETEKINIYDIVTDKIVNDIEKIIDDKTEIFIEGYSYSSAQGRLIDLVTFSTLLRFKLLRNKMVNLNVIPPSTLKKTIAEQVYESDKKGISRNKSGKAGGSFDKKDMMECLVQLDVTCEYLDYLRVNKDILLKPKSLAKPFDDCNDSMLLCYYGKLSKQV